MLVQPYLFFEGRCDEALEFYRKVLGAEVIRLMRYKDSPEPAMCPSGAENKVMHASFASARRPSWRPTVAARASRHFKVLDCRSQ
jgi:uncharacterized glyoxalase superfamily protein PhnB